MAWDQSNWQFALKLAGIWARIPPGQVIAVHVFDLARGKVHFHHWYLLVLLQFSHTHLVTLHDLRNIDEGFGNVTNVGRYHSVISASWIKEDQPSAEISNRTRDTYWEVKKPTSSNTRPSMPQKSGFAIGNNSHITRHWFCMRAETS